MKIKNSKHKELFYNLSFNKDFCEDIVKYRIKFGIPPQGFDNMTAQKKWFGNMTDYKNFINYDHILLKYKIPSQELENYFEQYIMNGGRPGMEWDEWPTHAENVFCQKSLSSKHIRQLKKFQVPFVKFELYIFDNASLKDVEKVLRKNWNGIKKSIAKQRGEKSTRIRASVNKNRDKKKKQFKSNLKK